MGIWTPEAQWVGPSPNQSGKMIEQRGMVLHVMQGSLAGSIAWGKNPASGVSFHFGTRKSDGLVQQLVSTDVTAWTQCSGNGRWVSVENEDYSGNPLSAAQIESVARLYARGMREYAWPLRITDDPNGRGLGWHGMGGVPWCNHPNCPGQPIKDQRPAILARAAQILGGTGTTEGDEMIAHMWRGTDGKNYLVTGPLALKQALTDEQAGTVRYYAAGAKNAAGVPTLPGFTLVDLPTPTDPAVIPGADITKNLAGGSVGGLTYDQTVEAAREGAELAEDS